MALQWSSQACVTLDTNKELLVEYEQALADFDTLNRQRIERLRALAPVNQQLFFDVLALLFHTNNPILPIEFEESTPAGIVGYQPTKDHLDSAKLINKQFQFKQASLRDYPIAGLYLINESGIISYPSQPHFTLWIVLSATHRDEQDALISKVAKISEWALSLGIQLSHKIIVRQSNPDYALNFFELDNFYLNGLLMAGSIPTWWLVSAESDYSAEAHIIRNAPSLIKVPILDLGDLPKPTAEPLQHVVTQLLDQHLDSGLDQLYQLAYLQYQLEQFGHFKPLSEVMKLELALSEEGMIDVLQVDNNLLKLKQLSDRKLNPDTLTLVQTSLYIEFKERLSQKITQPKHPWRRQKLMSLVKSWQWDKVIYEQLDARANANYAQCQAELTRTLPFLISINASLTNFCQQHALPTTSGQQSILKRLNYLSSDKSDNLIPVLPERMRAKNHEEFIYIYRFKDRLEWKINDTPISKASAKTLYQHESLLNVMSWAIVNGLLGKSTRIAVADSKSALDLKTVHNLIAHLLSSPIVKQNTTVDLESNAKPELRYLSIIINLEHQPMAKFSQQGIKLSSLQNDPLNYADRGETLITSIDGLLYSSLGEWQTFHLTGNASPVDMLAELAPWWSPTLTHDIDLWCNQDTLQKTIAARINDFYHDVFSYYKKSVSAGTYIIRIGDIFYALEWQENGFDVIAIPKAKTPLSALARRRQSFSPTYIPQSLDKEGLLAILLKFQSSSRVSIFIYSDKKTVYILDEKGAVNEQSYPNLNEPTLIRHFQTFFNAVDLPQLTVHFFKLSRSPSWRLERLAEQTPDTSGSLPVTVEMSKQSLSSSCTIKCGSKAFNGQINDPILFQQVAHFTLNLRKTNTPYSLYINELKFSQATQNSTYDYVFYKHYIEKHLNLR
jgi:adenylate cyclase class 1